MNNTKIAKDLILRLKFYGNASIKKKLEQIMETKIAVSEKMKIMDQFNFSFPQKLTVALDYYSSSEYKRCTISKRANVVNLTFQVVNKYFYNIQKTGIIKEGEFRKYVRFLRAALSKGIEIQDSIDEKIKEGVPRLKSVCKRFTETYNTFKKNYYNAMNKDFQTIIPKSPLNDDVIIQIYSFL
jgi:hypothetical protein